MSERPILFSSSMVRAILDGRKTQTRRVVTPQPELVSGALYWHSRRYDNGDGAQYFHTPEPLTPSLLECWAKAALWRPGDLLWVRETWAGEVATVAFSSTPGIVEGSKQGMVAYRASFQGDASPFGRWKPSIHMPKWAARIWLRVTDVRVERVAEITPTGAVAEGVRCDHGYHYCTQGCGDPVGQFAALWDSLNADRGYDFFGANPWVWVVSFERHTLPSESAVDVPAVRVGDTEAGEGGA